MTPPRATTLPVPATGTSAPVAAGSSGPSPYAAVGRSRNEGHGKRLTAAFEALEVFPALAESRNRLLALVAEERPSIGDMVRAIESDVALVIAIMRLANGFDSPRRGQVDSIVGAVEVISPEAVHQLATNAETFEFFERGKKWDAAPERFRLHAVAVQRAADRLAAAAGYQHRDRLLVTALLHDIGKLVLMHAYPGYPQQVHQGARTPEERIHRERRELGVDHALVGGVLARRWNLPKAVASAIERAKRESVTAAAVSVTRNGKLVSIEVGSGSGNGRVLLIGFDREHTTPIGRGENGGRTLTEANIVRSIRPVGQWSGRPLKISEQFPEGQDVAVVLEAPNGQVIGASRLADGSS